MSQSDNFARSWRVGSKLLWTLPIFTSDSNRAVELGGMVKRARLCRPRILRAVGALPQLLRRAPRGPDRMGRRLTPGGLALGLAGDADQCRDRQARAQE